MEHMRQDYFDIAIIGGGPAGLAAAIEAAKAGCSVAVYERRDKVGGARDGGCGFFGVESSIQKAEHNPLTKKDAFEFMMEHAHWKTNARLVSEYIRFSASTVEWMKDEIGLPITHTSGYYPGAAETMVGNFVGVEVVAVAVRPVHLVPVTLPAGGLVGGKGHTGGFPHGAAATQQHKAIVVRAGQRFAVHGGGRFNLRSHLGIFHCFV